MSKLPLAWNDQSLYIFDISSSFLFQFDTICQIPLAAKANSASNSAAQNLFILSILKYSFYSDFYNRTLFIPNK